MVDTNGFSVGSVITIVVVALLAGTMIPPAINATTDADFSTQTESFGLSEGETYNFTNVNTSATLESVNASGNEEASYLFESKDTTENATVSLAEGGNESITLDGTQYNVSVTQVDSVNNEATASVEYETGDGGTSSTIWGMVPLFIVLAIALVFVGYATQARDGL